MRRTGPKMTKPLVVLVAAGMFLLLSGCTSASGTADLIAENGAFNKSTIRVETNQEVSIVFENKDNITHNFAVYASSEARLVVFKGEALPGPGTITYTFIVPESAGYYYFQCDFHPSTMNGGFVVYGSSS